MILRNLLVIAFALLTGCATLINGRTQNIPVKTTPKEATVTAEENSTLTPATFTLERNRDYLLTITKEGYETQKIKIVHVINAASAGNLLTFGMIGVAIDTATGACWTLKPEEITITLQPLSFHEKFAENAHLNEKTLQNQLASLKQLEEANLLTDTQYKILRDLTIHCVESG